MNPTVIEVSLTDLDGPEDDRIEQIVEMLANDVVPSIAEVTGLSGTALAARLLVEMAYIVGFTHHPAEALELLANAGHAMRAGVADSEETAREAAAEPPTEGGPPSDPALEPKTPGGTLH